MFSRRCGYTPHRVSSVFSFERGYLDVVVTDTVETGMFRRFNLDPGVMGRLIHLIGLVVKNQYAPVCMDGEDGVSHDVLVEHDGDPHGSLRQAILSQGATLQ